MSAGGFSGSHGARGHGSQDFELNLASIIDCFTVLIAFMLATASFLSIGILDAGIAAAGPAAASAEPPPVNLIIEIGADRSIQLKLTGKENRTEKVAAGAAGVDLDLLSAQLAEVKKRWPTLNAVTLQAENSIEYKEVIRAMEATRKTLPVVLLGGF